MKLDEGMRKWIGRFRAQCNPSLDCVPSNLRLVTLARPGHSGTTALGFWGLLSGLDWTEVGSGWIGLSARRNIVLLVACCPRHDSPGACMSRLAKKRSPCSRTTNVPLFQDIGPFAPDNKPKSMKVLGGSHVSISAALAATHCASVPYSHRANHSSPCKFPFPTDGQNLGPRPSPRRTGQLQPWAETSAS